MAVKCLLEVRGKSKPEQPLDGGSIDGRSEALELRDEG